VVAKTYLLLGKYRTRIKLPPVDSFRHVICSRETFQRETLFNGTLDALPLWPNMQRSAPEISVTFCKYFANPTLILNLTLSSESQRNVDSNDILSVRKYVHSHDRLDCRFAHSAHAHQASVGCDRTKFSSWHTAVHHMDPQI